ncbi:MAG: 2-isopropylmalate synthase, partial [Alphaproteobacteria bacterium]
MTQHDHVRIFDTTMRDGEQSPGAAMTMADKIEIARQLDAMGVDVIEAGFPAASNGDFEAVRAVGAVLENAVLCGLSRAGPKDIERCAEAIKSAKRFRIHTFISTSPIHRKHKLNMEAHQVLDAVTASVTLARKFTDDVEWSAEDATRTERDFLKRCVEAAIRAGATTINIPDTVGYSFPDEYRELFRDLIESVPGADKAIFSAHCHNDLGLAVANSIAAVQGGARQIECAVNGLGERAGNAALEEIVMAFRVRGADLPYQTNIDTPQLMRISQTVARVTGFPVQFNKAIVGKNAFSHESGIHQDGMLKHTETYEIMRPEDVGQGATSLVMGKLSGRHAFKKKLEELGYTLADNALNDAFQRFKELCDRKRHVFDEDIVALVDDQIAHADDPIQVSRLRVVAGTEGPQTAEIDLTINGEPVWKTARGNGPVDAIFNAIKEAAPHEADLELYQVHAVTEGTDAQAIVSVRLSAGGRSASARASDADTLVASARAYVAALNRLNALASARISAQH